MNAFKPPYVKNGPLLSLVDGHYPAFREIKGLNFTISIVMSATDLSATDGINREIQAQRLVDAWNMFDPLIDFIRDIDLIEHPDAGDHNPLCQGGESNATVLDAIIARARELKATLAAVGAA